MAGSPARVISRGRSRSRSRSSSVGRKRRRTRSSSRARGSFLPLNGFPTTLVAKHRYVETVTVPYTPASGATVVNYQINGVYAPNLSTILDHQPKGFDEMMAIYKTYTVIGAKMTVRNVQTDVKKDRSFMWGIYGTPNATGSTGGLYAKGETDILETKGVVKRFCVPNNVNAAIMNNVVATYKYSPKKVFGKNFVITDRNQGDSGHNPTEAYVIQLWVQGLFTDPAGAIEKGANFLVSIDYIVKYSERKLLPQS